MGIEGQQGSKFTQGVQMVQKRNYYEPFDHTWMS